MKRMISGIKPSGNLTLGNYLGSIKNFIKYQSEYELFIFIANLHALNSNTNKEELEINTKNLIALYLACGLKSTNIIFLQSHILEHTYLNWIFTSLTSMGELSRMTQYKDKSKKDNKENINSALFMYPCLMAADILLYDADFIPVGDDQKQHIEFTRNLAEKFNKKYKNIFKLPEAKIEKTGSRIMSLSNPEKKMSKSEKDDDKGIIYLLDDKEVIRKKIMAATTDNDKEIIYNKKEKPGISNLLEIYSSIKDITIKEAENMFKDSGYGDFKKEVANEVIKLIENIQTEYNKYINSNEIFLIIEKGRIEANKIAAKKIKEIEKAIGLDL